MSPNMTSTTTLGRSMLIRGVAYVVCAVVSVPVCALDESGQAEDIAIEEVVVTARKREEHLLDIPMNIAVIGKAEITNRNLLDKRDGGGEKDR